MPIFRLTKDAIQPLPPTSFAQHGITERPDLQRLLRASIGVVAPDVLVNAEAFDQWEDSKRRIDLLALDRDAKLVVIELKRRRWAHGVAGDPLRRDGLEDDVCGSSECLPVLSRQVG